MMKHSSRSHHIIPSSHMFFRIVLTTKTNAKKSMSLYGSPPHKNECILVVVVVVVVMFLLNRKSLRLNC